MEELRTVSRWETWAGRSDWSASHWTHLTDGDHPVWPVIVLGESDSETVNNITYCLLGTDTKTVSHVSVCLGLTIRKSLM